jgi:gamma-glutamylcyclotransferase (GGCT)/AIG2-like uncharacterized protein YtfP
MDSQDQQTENHSMPEENLLFVYGTLRRNARCMMARWLASQAEYIGCGQTPGRLYDVGDYPALRPVKHPGETVIGDIYRLRRPRYTLARLDRYEGIGTGQSRPYQYCREERVLTLHNGVNRKAWVYIYMGETARLRRIASGDYLHIGGPRQYRPVKVRRGAR